MTQPATLALLLAAAIAASGVAPGARAQEAAGEGRAALALELNDAAPAEGSCRLTFLVRNELGADVAGLSLETVILTTDGRVERLTLFDFRDLPASRPRVRQFDLAGLDCAALGQVLVNGVAACEGDGLDPAACGRGLALSSRIGVELIG